MNTNEIKNWHRLFEACIKINQIKPWHFLKEEQLVVLQLENKKIPIIASLIGSSQDCFGITLFHTVKAQKMLANLLFKTIDIVDPISYEATLQESLTCYFSNRDELDQEDYQLIKELGYSFNGKYQWPQFISMTVGYVPRQLSSEEVTLFTDCLELLYPHLFEMAQQETKRSEFQTFIISHKKIEALLAPYPLYENNRPIKVPFKNELMVRKLKKQAMTNLNLDLTYLYTNQIDESEEVMVLILGVDTSNGDTLITNFALGNQPIPPIIFQDLNDLILNIGRPQKINVRIEDLYYHLVDFCEQLEIELVLEPNLTKLEEVCSTFTDFLI